jgi:hypothetical protein
MISGAFYDQETEAIVYWVPPGVNEQANRYFDDGTSDSGESVCSGDTILSCEVTGEWIHRFCFPTPITFSRHLRLFP